MIRILEQKPFTDGLNFVKLAGLSTEAEDKPTTGIVTGSEFLEVDTGDVYAFAEGDSPAWYKIKAGVPAEAET